MSDTKSLIQRLFLEATAACGDDPLAIERHVLAQLDAMSESDRRLFRGVAEQISAYKHDAIPSAEPQ